MKTPELSIAAPTEPAQRANRPRVCFPGRLRTRGAGFILVFCLLLLWEISARAGWAESTNWPPFSLVLVAVWDGVFSGELPALLGVTLWRMLVGYSIGCACGIAAGLALGSSMLLRQIFNPLVEVFRPMPISAIIPPLILFLGIGDALKIFVVAFSSFFPVLINTIEGVRAGSGTLLQTARTFRIGARATMCRVIFPSALPSIFAGLRTSLSIALVVTITAEMIAGSGGIGYFIVQTQYAMLPAPMYAAVICLAVIGYLLNRVFIQIQDRLMPWYGESKFEASA